MSINAPALMAECVKRDLQQAEVIAAILVEDTGFQMKEGKTVAYREWTYVVAWKREDQCGTHRVNVNNIGESMATSGHYDFPTADKAIHDMLDRLPSYMKEIITNA